MEKRSKLRKKLISNPETIEKYMTKQKDTDLLILSNLDDRSLLNFCIANRYGKELCSDENFWRNRLIEKWGNPSFIPQSWKRIYLKTISIDDKYEIDWELYLSARAKDVEMVNFLIYLGAESNFMGLRGAIEVGDINLVKFFLSRMEAFQYDINDLLTKVSFFGYKDLIEFFIEEGGNIDSALKGAINSDYPDKVTYILDKMPPPTLQEIKNMQQIAMNYKAANVFGFFLSLEEKEITKLKKSTKRRK